MRFIQILKPYGIEFYRTGANDERALVGGLLYRATPPAQAEAYAEVMVAALNLHFGTPVPVAAEEIGEFLGVPIPPALHEVAHRLHSGAGKEPAQRTPAEAHAILRFLQYCDAEGITIEAAPAMTDDERAAVIAARGDPTP